jgi:hypothetical protein
MAVYIGVDLQVRTQTVCWLDTADGEEQQLSLDHERDNVRPFYSRFPFPRSSAWKLPVIRCGSIASSKNLVTSCCSATSLE